jgi:aspartyl aminopeptidase
MAKKVDKFDKLLFKSESFWEKASNREQDLAMEFSDEYIKFLNNVKTERQVVAESVKQAKKEGYREVDLDGSLGKADKLIFTNREKSVIMINLGFKGLDMGAKFLMAHTDSPRLDLKVKPLYEDSGIAYLKPNYYGGIKKYHWPTVPLEMHGKVILKNGSEVEISLGSKKDEPQFVISDLLPHLEKERMDKKFGEAIAGEELNIIVGSIPVKGKELKDKVKLSVLEKLNKEYGIIEQDFLSADLHFVPAYTARDIGFDRSMIGGYGQDDRVCVYTSLRAFLEGSDGVTKILYLADKEEIGSMGTTGAESLFLENVIDFLLRQTKSDLSVYDVFRKSFGISADVTAAYDPDYKEAFDKINAIELGHGVVIEKYLGYRGKAGTVDSDPHFLRTLMDSFDKKSVIWQTGHLGKVDQGGGGTIAVYLANRNMEVVDMGVPLLNMHAPFEVSSKADVYSTYKGYKTFLEN